MKTQSVSETEQWANVSRTQGLWSAGLLILNLFFDVLTHSEYYDERSGTAFVLSCLFIPLFFGTLIFGLATCIFALIALWRNSRESNDATIKRRATIGLVLGGITVVVFPILLFV